MVENHGEDSASSGDTLNDTQPSHPDAPSANRSPLVGTLGDEQSSHFGNLDGERTVLQPQQPENLAAVPDQETKLQTLSRDLEAVKIRLDCSERERQSLEKRLAKSISECDESRKEPKAYKQITDTLDMIAVLLDVELGEIVDAVAKLKVDHRRKTLLLKWVYTEKAIDWETRATPAEASLAVYADAGDPAQVPAVREETVVTDKRNEALTSTIEAKEKALQLDEKKVTTVEEAGSTNEKRIKDLEHELKAAAVSVSQMEQENTTLLGQLDLARTKSESAQQGLLDRLDTILQKRLEPIELENMLQIFVDKQNTALADVQKELVTVQKAHTATQEELVNARKDHETSSSDFWELRRKLMETLRSYTWDTASNLSRLEQWRDELTALNLSLKSIQGDFNLIKVEVLKTACEDLDTASKELEVVRTERDGIYKTLNVSGCLGAHLTIGDLKLAQLACEMLRKAIGDFEDEEAVDEIKRLKKANVELVKVESALYGCAGQSNVAKIDTLKAACEMK
jgi:septal ring factor EnvC (AmiA/AmiB activator)